MTYMPRRVFIGSALGGALALASGCSADTSVKSSSSTSLETGSMASFLKSAGKRFEGTTLNVLTVSSPQAESVKALTSEFTSLTGINVQYTAVAENELITRTQVTLSSKSAGFDIFQIESFFVPLYAKNNWLVPVESLQEKSDVTFPDLDTKGFTKSSLDQLKQLGKTWALPMFLATQVVYYRTDVFDTAGVAAPTSIDDMEALCKKVNGQEIPAMAMRAGIGPTQNVFPWTAWLYNTGGRFFNTYSAANNSYSGPSLGTVKATEAADLYSRILRNYGPKGALNWKVADVTRAFLSGGVAMIQEGSPFGATVNDPKASSVAGKVGAFALPAGSAGQFAPSASQGWGINSFGGNQDAAWLFSQWATSAEVLTRASLEQSFSSPPRGAIFKDPRFEKKYGFKGFVGSLNASFATEASPVGGSYIPSLLNWQQVGNDVSVQLNEVINGVTKADAAMQKANAVLQNAG